MNRKRKKKKKKRHGSVHHSYPQSRGGPDKSWNMINKSLKDHQAFHTLFENLFPCEIVNKIREELTNKSGELKKNKLTSKQIIAWNFLFNTSPKRAIEIIKEDWTPKQCFRFKKCFIPNYSRKKCPVLKLYKEGKINSLF